MREVYDDVEGDADLTRPSVRAVDALVEIRDHFEQLAKDEEHGYCDKNDAESMLLALLFQRTKALLLRGRSRRLRRRRRVTVQVHVATEPARLHDLDEDGRVEYDDGDVGHELGEQQFRPEEVVKLVGGIGAHGRAHDGEAARAFVRLCRELEELGDIENDGKCDGGWHEEALGPFECLERVDDGKEALDGDADGGVARAQTRDVEEAVPERHQRVEVRLLVVVRQHRQTKREERTDLASREDDTEHMRAVSLCWLGK